MKKLKEGTSAHKAAIQNQHLNTRISKVIGTMYAHIDDAENLDRLTLKSSLFHLKSKTHNFQAQLVFTSDVDKMIETEDIVSSNKSEIEEAQVVEENDPNQLELNFDKNENSSK